MVPAQKETIQPPKCIPSSHPMMLYAKIVTKMRKVAAVAQNALL